ncbi:hypothetical protein KC19_VG031200 [Ceratodon purpureus]|uniref:Uncharacterized protein n=1 Tax=Ceratodon purpureus TaxID=3225 RepID=A0A8T0HLP5_CERPU|nr:hypothetical protein KC19_VG031200 [Ceratodon purpureus]KAG0571654.1 hypothetical protein KC19_VG031200 [Ceratodon purpureus]
MVDNRRRLSTVGKRESKVLNVQPVWPITLQACGKYVYLKIAKGLQVEREKKDLISKMWEDIKFDVGAMHMQELRMGRFRQEYKLEVALTKHLNAMKASQETAPVPSTGEKEALGRKEEGEDLLHCMDKRQSACRGDSASGEGDQNSGHDHEGVGGEGW